MPAFACITYRRCVDVFCAVGALAVAAATLCVPGFDTELAVILALGLLLLRGTPHLLEIWQKRDALFGERREEGLLRKLTLLVPPGVSGLLAMDFAAHRSFFLWLRGIPYRAVPPPGLNFGFARAPSYPTAVAILFLAVLVDVPIAHLLIHAFVESPSRSVTLHLIVVVVTVYGLVWIAADRHALASTSHVATEIDLQIELGFRAIARIPLTEIERTELIAANTSPRDYRELRQLTRAECVVVTPFDDPNVALWLKAGSSVNVRIFGSHRRNVRVMLLYVDEPKAMVRALNAESVRADALRENT